MKTKKIIKKGREKKKKIPVPFLAIIVQNWREILYYNVQTPKGRKENFLQTRAFAGSRTRVYCLEGNYPNRWTTNAELLLDRAIYMF